MAEISDELRRRFRARADDPDHREPVVVTLHRHADTAVLSQAGLQIRHVLRARPIVTGTLDAAALEQLAKLDVVARIEPDGEMHALDG
jgi:hypothetical protein